VFLDGAPESGLGHPSPIVADPDTVDPARLDCDGDACGVGVDAVFDEFFHHRCGPLDDFAGRYPLDGPCVQFLDLRPVVPCHESCLVGCSTGGTPLRVAGRALPSEKPSLTAAVDRRDTGRESPMDNCKRLTVRTTDRLV